MSKDRPPTLEDKANKAKELTDAFKEWRKAIKAKLSAAERLSMEELREQQTRAKLEKVRMEFDRFLTESMPPKE